MVHNTYSVQVPIPLLFLPVGIPYEGATQSTRTSTVPVATIVGGQTSKLAISRDGQDSITIQPQKDHTLPPERIIVQNIDSSNDN